MALEKLLKLGTPIAAGAIKGVVDQTGADMHILMDILVPATGVLSPAAQAFVYDEHGDGFEGIQYGMIGAVLTGTSYVLTRGAMTIANFYMQ